MSAGVDPTFACDDCIRQTGEIAQGVEFRLAREAEAASVSNP
jgi:hypothetical protein